MEVVDEVEEDVAKAYEGNEDDPKVTGTDESN